MLTRNKVSNRPKIVGVVIMTLGVKVFQVLFIDGG